MASAVIIGVSYALSSDATFPFEWLWPGNSYAGWACYCIASIDPALFRFATAEMINEARC